MKYFALRCTSVHLLRFEWLQMIVLCQHCSALEKILFRSDHQFPQFCSRYINFKNDLAVTEISGSDDLNTELVLCVFNEVDTWGKLNKTRK